MSFTRLFFVSFVLIVIATLQCENIKLQHCSTKSLNESSFNTDKLTFQALRKRTQVALATLDTVWKRLVLWGYQLNFISEPKFVGRNYQDFQVMIFLFVTRVYVRHQPYLFLLLRNISIDNALGGDSTFGPQSIEASVHQLSLWVVVLTSFNLNLAQCNSKTCRTPLRLPIGWPIILVRRSLPRILAASTQLELLLTQTQPTKLITMCRLQYDIKHGLINVGRDIVSI